MAIVPVLDWIAITGMAALLTDFDYRYWPPGRARIVSVVFLAITVGVLVIYARPDNPPLWPLVPVSIALIAWGVVGCCDVFAQRRAGYRVPPSYGERDS